MNEPMPLVSVLSKPLSLQDFVHFEKSTHPKVIALIEPQDEWFVRGHYPYPANFAQWLEDNVPSGREVFCSVLVNRLTADGKTFCEGPYSAVAGREFMSMSGKLVRIKNPNIEGTIGNQGQPPFVWCVKATIGHVLSVEVQGDWMSVRHFDGDVSEMWHRTIQNNQPHWVLIMSRSDLMGRCKILVEEQCPFHLHELMGSFKSRLLKLFTSCVTSEHTGDFPNQWFFQTTVDRIMNGLNYEHLFMHSKMVATINKKLLTPLSLQILFDKITSEVNDDIALLRTQPIGVMDMRNKVKEIAYGYAERIAQEYLCYFQDHPDAHDPMTAEEFMQHLRDSVRTIVQVIRMGDEARGQLFQDHFFEVKIALGKKYAGEQLMNTQLFQLLSTLCSHNHRLNTMAANPELADYPKVDAMASALLIQLRADLRDTQDDSNDIGETA